MGKQGFIGGHHAIKSFIEKKPQNALRLYYSASHRDRMRDILQLAKMHHIPYEQTEVANIAHGMESVAHQGIVLAYIIDKPESLASWLDKRCYQDPPVILILDQIQDPQNLGSCLRLAAAFAADAIIIPQKQSVGLNATVAKVSSGAHAIVPIIEVVNITRAIDQLKKAGFWIYGTDESATKTVDQADMSVAVAWVMGNEERGMRQGVSKACDEHFIIPVVEDFSTLNVAMSSGICLYETYKQRKKLASES